MVTAPFEESQLGSSATRSRRRDLSANRGGCSQGQGTGPSPTPGPGRRVSAPPVAPLRRAWSCSPRVPSRPVSLRLCMSVTVGVGGRVAVGDTVRLASARFML